MSAGASKRADQARDDLRKSIVNSRPVPDETLGGALDSDLFNPKRSFVVGMGATRQDAEEIWKEAKEVVGVTNVAADLMRERGIGKSQAYRIARQQSAEEALKTPFPSALKDQVLEVLYAEGRQDAANLLGKLRSKDVSPTMQELTAAIWSCQKQGWVAFRESHSQHGSVLTNIKLTPAGRQRAIDNRGTPYKQAATRVNGPSVREGGHSDSLRHGATHAIGVDKTSPFHHTSRTTGGEIERHRPVQFSKREGVVCGWDKEAWPCMTAQKWTKAEQNARPVEMREGPGQVRIQRVEASQPSVQPRQNEKPGEWTRFTDEVDPAMEAVMAKVDEVGFENVGEPVTGEETPPIVFPKIVDVIDWSQYPLMSAAFERDKKAAKYRAAAEILQDDDPDAAVELLEKVKFSELEQEVVRLLAELGM